MHPRTGRYLTGAAGIALIPLVLAAGWDAHRTGTLSGARTGLTIIAPAAPGGGWDTVARELQAAMRENDVVSNPQVVNVPGAAGTIGLSQLLGMDGQEDVIMVTGTVMIGGIAVNDSPQDLTTTTPVARIADDYEVLVVPADSPYQTLDDLLAAWTQDPGSIAIGGGSLGGTDQLLAALIAQNVGIDPAEVNYIPYAGGGEAVASLLSGASALGISGWNEFADQVESGNLRALALSAPEPQPQIDVPTLMEQGIDLHLPNWRGVVAPPGLTDAETSELLDIIDETIATDEWQDALERNSWQDTELLGEEYGQFIEQETERIDGIVQEAGL